MHAQLCGTMYGRHVGDTRDNRITSKAHTQGFVLTLCCSPITLLKHYPCAPYVMGVIIFTSCPYVHIHTYRHQAVNTVTILGECWLMMLTMFANKLMWFWSCDVIRSLTSYKALHTITVMFSHTQRSIWCIHTHTLHTNHSPTQYTHTLIHTPHTHGTQLTYYT